VVRSIKVRENAFGAKGSEKVVQEAYRVGPIRCPVRDSEPRWWL